MEVERTPEKRREEIELAMAGVFMAYSSGVLSPFVLEAPIQLENGQTKSFMVFGALGEESDQYKPEVLVIMSEDAQTRIVARARWGEEGPKVEEVDSILGMVTLTGRVEDMTGNAMAVSNTEIQSQGVSRQELISVINKIALSLRFPQGQS